MNEPKPFPVTVTICGECGQLWAQHLKLVATVEDDGQMVSDEADITLYQCVELLKRANQGPPGPPGPMGPMGLMGRSA